MSRLYPWDYEYDESMVNEPEDDTEDIPHVPLDLVIWLEKNNKPKRVTENTTMIQIQRHAERLKFIEELRAFATRKDTT